MLAAEFHDSHVQYEKNAKMLTEKYAKTISWDALRQVCLTKAILLQHYRFSQTFRSLPVMKILTLMKILSVLCHTKCSSILLPLSIVILMRELI